ncbi:transcriptional repressor [Orbilia ellipsospora]|uniref:Transcriptional repressor n=1 Tax=Orbilia ellipsospora TaxID=2528407 RepID=A0AAV9XDE8_9PEZI
MDPLAIRTSAGRRVSILCDQQPRPSYRHSESYFSSSSYEHRSPSPPPLSLDMRRPYRSDRSDSYSSIASAYSEPRTPLTPDGMHLPALGKLLHNYPEGYRPSMSSRSSSASSCSSSISSQSPVLSTRCIEEEEEEDEDGHLNQGVKKSARKYTCQCGKSFTTSGHLARHTRIHTGEKNYECPQPGCGARFSRQDNCMQHYRTHQGGGGSKRSARKKRLEAPVIIADTNQYPSHGLHYLPDETFSREGGLAALASIAMDRY